MKSFVKKLFWRVIGLALVVAAVVALVRLSRQEMVDVPSDTDTAEETSDGAAAEEKAGEGIVSMSYTNNACALYFALNERGEWYWVGNAAFPLDAAYVQEILAAVKNLTPQQVMPVGESLADFGLDNPTATIRTTSEAGETTVCCIGSKLEDGTYYMMYEGGEVVYTVDTPLYDLTRRTIIDMVIPEELPVLSEGQLIAITLERMGESVRYTAREGKWFAGAEDKSTDPQLRALIESICAWKLGKCVDYQPSLEALEVCGFTEPTAKITVEYSDEKSQAQQFSLTVGIKRADGQNRFVGTSLSTALYEMPVDALAPMVDSAVSMAGK